MLMGPEWHPERATSPSPSLKKTKPHLSLICTGALHPTKSDLCPTRTPSPPNLEGPQLFDFVRKNFCAGLSTLDNLLRYLELHGASDCVGRKKGIESLLQNLLTLAQWLISYVDNVRLWQCANIKAKAAIIGTRVELEQYSLKVTRVGNILASAKI